MGALLVVIATPGFSLHASIFQRQKPVLVQTFCSHTAIERFNIGVIRRHSGTAEVVIKAEVHAAGTNRRAVVTNRPGALIIPEGLYDDYIQRGESENRNNELKIDLCGGRLSDHRFMANLLRLNATWD